MWARYLEFVLAGWLALSPFVFGHGPDEPWRWVNDLTCAVVVGGGAALSYRPRLEQIHLVNALVGVWLTVAGLLDPTLPAPPAVQNWVVVGLLLVMLGVLPSHATQPPRAWREFDPRRSERD